MEILKVEHLSKSYGKGETLVRALDDVSFTVSKGEFVAIVGKSGSGKSTLLHILGGVDRPTSGKVYVEGEDVYRLNETNLAIFRRRQVGLIYQFYNLIPILNVTENMTLPILLDNQKVDEGYLQELVEVYIQRQQMLVPILLVRSKLEYQKMTLEILQLLQIMLVTMLVM